MKNYGIGLSLLVVGITILPIAYGLRCYNCVSDKNAEILGTYHEDCKEGDLPDSIGAECTLSNTMDPKTMKPLTAGEVKQNMVRVCTKLQGKWGDKDLTWKSCSYNITSATDRCGSNDLGTGWSSGTYCECFNDLCNGAPKMSGSLVPSIIVGLVSSFLVVTFY